MAALTRISALIHPADRPPADLKTGLQNPLLYLVLLLLPSILFFSGWRYWWTIQTLLQLLVCLAGLVVRPWRVMALIALAMIGMAALPWFQCNPSLPESCRQQIDSFSGIAVNDSFDSNGPIKLIKIELWCKQDFQPWPSAELHFDQPSKAKRGWFRTGDRIQFRDIIINHRDRFALDLTPGPRFRVYNLKYQEQAQSRGPVLLYVQKKARYYLQPFTHAVYKALITADRSSMLPRWKEWISDLGITHLFAISGMHIGILFLWFSFLLRWLISFPGAWSERGSGVLLTDLVAMGSIYIFLVGIGMPISAERAFIMLAWWGVMRHFMSWQPLWFILGGTAFIILSGAPEAIGQKSFQLSFLSVAGIILILPLLPRRRLQDNFLRILLKMGIASMVVSAWLFLLTMPLVSQLADRFSLLTPVNNVLHIYYLSFVFLPFALLVTFISLIGYPWSGMPIEFYLYAPLNFLGRIWEQMLTINADWNQLFLFHHLKRWGPLPALGWLSLLVLFYSLARFLSRIEK